jgi:5-deoxy-D-glucuronate isomerase
MSELIIDNENNKGRINNVTFCYVKLQEGAYKYQSKTEREYTVDCVVDKATAKAYKKVFPKNGYREIDTQDFEGIFKIAPIFPESDEQLIIKLKANAQVKRDI